MSSVCVDTRPVISHNCTVDNTKVLALLAYLSKCHCDINMSEYEANDSNFTLVQLLTVAIEKCDKWLELPNLNEFEYTAQLYVILIDHVFEKVDQNDGCILLEKFLNKMITCNFTVRSQFTKLKFIKQWFIVMRNDNSRVGIWCKYLIRGCSLRKFTSFLLPTSEELIRTITMQIPILLKLDLLIDSIFIITQMLSRLDKYDNENEIIAHTTTTKQCIDMYFKLLLDNYEHLVKYTAAMPQLTSSTNHHQLLQLNNFDDRGVDKYSANVAPRTFDKSSYMVTISAHIVHSLITNIKFLAMVYSETVGDHPTMTTFNLILRGDGDHKNILNDNILGSIFKLIKAIVSVGDLDSKLAMVSDIFNDQLKKLLDITNPVIFEDIFRKIDFVYKLKPSTETTLDQLASTMPNITSDDSTEGGIEAFLLHLQQLHLFECEIDGIKNTVKILSNIMHNSPKAACPPLNSSLSYLSDIAEKFKLISQTF